MERQPSSFERRIRSVQPGKIQLSKSFRMTVQFVVDFKLAKDVNRLWQERLPISMNMYFWIRVLKFGCGRSEASVLRISSAFSSCYCYWTFDLPY